MEASKARNASKRVLFVEEQVIGASNTATRVGPAAEETEEESKAGEADAEHLRNEQLKADWTKQFLEKQGFSFVLTHFLEKQVGSDDAVNFSEQASLKDVTFLMTLLNVFLQAGFASSQGDADDQVRIVEGSQDQADRDSSFVKLMKSPAGVQVMQSTDFG